MPLEPDLTFGDVDDETKPLAVLVHGFPDTPYTWRHLGPMLADAGYRAVATWLPGYREGATGPISVGTYVRHILEVAKSYGADERSVLIGHDWGAISGYGAVVTDPAAFRAYVALAVPPTPAIGAGSFVISSCGGRSTSGSSSRSASPRRRFSSQGSGSRCGRI